MTVVELKEQLIAKINHIDNEAVLKYLSIAIEFEEKTEEIYKLSPEELTAVKEGIAQIDNGSFLTNEEVNQLTDKCLGR